MKRLAEYVWRDVSEPAQPLRSKARVVNLPEDREARLDDFLISDSACSVANGVDGDMALGLVPVRAFDHPLRRDNTFVVLCEVAGGKRA